MQTAGLGLLGRLCRSQLGFEPLSACGRLLGLPSCLRGFGLGAAPLRRLAIGFGLFAPSLLLVSLALRLGLAGGCLPFLLQRFFLLAPEGNHPRILRRLRGPPRDHDGRFPRA
jgi:hypothetical protein